MKRAMSTDRSAAIVTVKDADRMSVDGRKDIARWLRRQAGFLEKYGSEFAGTFRARYIFVKEKK